MISSQVQQSDSSHEAISTNKFLLVFLDLIILLLLLILSLVITEGLPSCFCVHKLFDPLVLSFVNFHLLKKLALVNYGPSHRLESLSPVL